MMRKVLIALGAGALVAGALGTGAKADPVKLAVGTPAAPDSPWGQVFKTWKKAVEKSSGDAVSFDFFFNSTKGTEATMVDKIKAGELDGAAVTSIGLGKLDKRLLTIQLPGLMHSWKTVDAVRDAMAADFEKMLTDKKVTLITWGDVGYAHFLSNKFEVKVPDDLKGKSPWVYSEDLILKSVYSKIPGSTPFPDELMSVGNDVDTGKINCMDVSALAAEMLQWNSKFDHGVDSVDGIVVGAVIMSTDRLDKLPGDGKKIVIDTGVKMGTSSSGLKQRIRNEDAAAWERFKARSGVVIHTPTDDEKAKWTATFKDARESLKKGTFDPALVTKIETTANANQ